MWIFIMTSFTLYDSIWIKQYLFTLSFISWSLTSSFHSWLFWFLMEFAVIYLFLFTLLLSRMYIGIYTFKKTISLPSSCSLLQRWTLLVVSRIQPATACWSWLNFKLHQVTLQKYHDKRVCFILSFDEHSTK